MKKAVNVFIIYQTFSLKIVVSDYLYLSHFRKLYFLSKQNLFKKITTLPSNKGQMVVPVSTSTFVNLVITYHYCV